MNDDWRIEVGFDDAGHVESLVDRLKTSELEDELSNAFHDRVIVSHDEDRVFLYAGDREQAEAARDHVLALARKHGWKLDADLEHWHPVAEEWEDPDVPLPSADAAIKAEHEEMIAAERRQTEESGHPEYEVRVELPSFHEASRFADTLRGESLPVVHRWRYLLIGVPDEDSGKQLVERIQEQAPAGSRVNLEGTWAMAYAERPPNPFAVFGGLGG
ncbi:MAG: hypothetical protein ACLGG5_04760 [Thermoleophilia bacterium]